MSASAKGAKAAKAPADRESGTHPVAQPAALSTRRLIERALGCVDNGKGSISAGAIETMAKELHALTFQLSALSARVPNEGLSGEIYAFCEHIAHIAYRAQAVAELERKFCSDDFARRWPTTATDLTRRVDGGAL